MGENPFDLSGRVAVVSGAGRGIGKAIAVALARAGADVAVFSRTEDQFRSTAAEIESMGRKALGLRVDVSKASDVEAMVSTVMDSFGGEHRSPDAADVCFPVRGIPPGHSRKVTSLGTLFPGKHCLGKRDFLVFRTISHLHVGAILGENPFLWHLAGSQGEMDHCSERETPFHEMIYL